MAKKTSSNKVSPQKANRTLRMRLFKEYGEKYKTHVYRWLNAKIRLDIKDFKCSDETVRQICKFLGIKSKSKHERQKYRKPREDSKNYDNLILNKLAPEEPFKVVVSDMTTMKYKGNYYEVTWYMDLFNNELISYGVSDRRGDSMTYYDGLEDLIKTKKNIQISLPTSFNNSFFPFSTESYISPLAPTDSGKL